MMVLGNHSLSSQNLSPTAPLRNSATGDIFRQAETKVDMNLAVQTC